MKSSTFTMEEEFEDLLEDQSDLVVTEDIKILKKNDSANNFNNNSVCSAYVNCEFKKDNGDNCICQGNKYHTNETITGKEANIWSIESCENREVISKHDKKCRLCLRKANTSDYVLFNEMYREILEILLTNVEIKENAQSVICNNCSNMLRDSFHFKSSCLDTEDSLTPFISPQNLGTLDISMVFQEIHRDQRNLLPRIANICRFCLEILEKDSFTFLKDLSEADLEMLKKVMPEMQLEATKEPLICEMCLYCFKVCFKFINDCLSTLKQCHNNSLISLNNNMGPISFSQNEIKSKKNNLVLSKADCGNSREPDDAILDPKGTKRKCHEKQPLTRHVDLPKCPEVKVYTCDKCPFQSKHRSASRRHRLVHDEGQVYKCDNCSFRTKYEGNMKQHRLIHEKQFEGKLYKCDKCPYQTPHKRNLYRHILAHKRPEEVVMYKCGKCPFQTKHKPGLKNHSVVHEKPEDVKLYKCELCQYTTKHKKVLVGHQLVHKDPSEVEQVFRCASCDFVSKWKASIKAHVLMHSDVFYDCEFCNFRTQRKPRLNRHLKQVHREKIKPVLTYR